MSRYLVKAINPKHRVTIGYDRAAGTTGAGYFAQVEDTELTLSPLIAGAI
ncbi:MAG: hypothetical protein WBF90_29305 [Rivularia sp. (in: cyanobacteria)]